MSPRLLPRTAIFRGFALLALFSAVPLMLGAGSDRTLVKQLDDEVIALRQRIQLLEQHCGADGQPPAIFPELAQLFTGTPVQVTRQGTHVMVRITAGDLFSVDGLTVREEAQPWLDLLATSLGVHGDTTVVLVGHSDGAAVPPALRTRYPTPWDWGMGEASAAGGQLISRYAVPAARLTFASHGATEPISSNDTPEGRAQNRRVEIHIFEGKLL